MENHGRKFVSENRFFGMNFPVILTKLFSGKNITFLSSSGYEIFCHRKSHIAYLFINAVTNIIVSKIHIYIYIYIAVL